MAADIRALRAEVATLTDRFRQASASSGGLTEEHVEAVTRMAHSFDLLPERIADAMTSALARQHRLIVNEIQSAVRQALAEARPAIPAAERPTRHRPR